MKDNDLWLIRGFFTTKESNNFCGTVFFGGVESLKPTEFPDSSQVLSLFSGDFFLHGESKGSQALAKCRPGRKKIPKAFNIEQSSTPYEHQLPH